MKIMNKLRLLLILGGVITLGAVSQSCLDENNEDVLLTRPTALVTVRPQQDGKVTLQLDERRRCILPIWRLLLMGRKR